MVKRTGVPTIVDLARKFCKTLSRLKPLIMKAVNQNEDVESAIDVALTACAALEIILEDYLVEGD